MSRITILLNSVKLNVLHNERIVVKNYCKPEEIYMKIDGDDELIGRQVLKLYNAVFQKNNLWFVYTTLISSQQEIGFSKPVPKSVLDSDRFRKGAVKYISHLRAFYVKLFLLIK
jgi:hypothetical protein